MEFIGYAINILIWAILLPFKLIRFLYYFFKSIFLYIWYGIKQKSSEGTYKNGKEIGRTWWYENGKKHIEEDYKDGKVIHVTIWKYWENGQMKEEKNMNSDDILDGVTTQWSENGNKRDEWEYKDGTIISEKHWNEDGSVKE